MVRYVFINDMERCIGCEACTVACKVENNVPLGVWRLRVKYVKVGAWPSVKRFFATLRCNHCEKRSLCKGVPRVCLVQAA